MGKNKLKINNKEYILPESVEYFFKQYLHDYYKNKKLNALSKKHDKLLTEYKNLSTLKFNKKRNLKLELYKINNEMMQIGIANNQNVEIPDFETIEDMDEKYKLLNKLNSLLCDSITILIYEINNPKLEKLHQHFNPIINTDKNIAKREYENKNYNTSFKKLYDSMEKNLILNKLMLQLDKNIEIDINSYIPKK